MRFPKAFSAFLATLLFLLLPMTLRAQFTFATNNGAITVLAYSGSGGAVTIPGFVAIIGASSFNQSPSARLVTAVTIPNSVTDIENLAFANCSGVANLNLGNGLISLEANAFSNCGSLTNVVIPNTVTNLGAAVFSDCTNLASVTLSSNLVSIGNIAFSQCASLASLAIPAATTNIGIEPFYYCTSLKSITVDPQNPVYSSLAGVWFNKNQTTLLQLPGGFAGSYDIPTNVTTVGSGALWNCGNLTNISISASVTNLPQGPLSGCSNLTAIVVDPQNPAYSSVAGVLFDKAQATFLQFPGGLAGSYAIPGGVTSIGGLAFSFCEGLTNVIVPAGVTNLGQSAFEDCYNLDSLYFEGNAPALGGSVFFYATNTTAYYLPGTTGWAGFSGPPTVLWNPQMQTSDGNFGVGTNGFGFNLTGNANLTVVIGACTNLTAPVWIPLSTNTLTGSSFYFSDPQWTSYPDRYYRLSPP